MAVKKNINFWQLNPTQPNPTHFIGENVGPNPTEPMDKPNPWPCLGALNAASWGRQKSRLSTNIWMTAAVRDRQVTVFRAVVYNNCGAPLFTAQIAKYHTPKRREQNTQQWIWSRTNSRRLCICGRRIEANYTGHWQTRSIARPLRDSRATCYVSVFALLCVYIVFVSFLLFFFKFYCIFLCSLWTNLNLSLMSSIIENIRCSLHASR